MKAHRYITAFDLFFGSGFCFVVFFEVKDLTTQMLLVFFWLGTLFTTYINGVADKDKLKKGLRKIGWIQQK